MRLSALLIAAIAFLPLTGWAKTSAELLDELRAAVKEEVAAASAPTPTLHPGGPGPGPDVAFRNRSLAQALGMLSTRLADLPTASRETDYGLEGLSSLASGSERITGLITALREQSHRERAEAAAAYLKSVETLTARARDAVLAAKTDRDLDPILDQITALKDRPEATDSTGRSPGAPRLDALSRAIVRWQDYLTQAAAGDWQSAMNTLRNINESTGSAPLLPRSEITSRLAAAREAEQRSRPQPTPTPDPEQARAKIDAIVANLKDPAQIPDALTAIAALRRETRNSGFGDEGLFQQLTELDNFRRQVLAGVTVDPSLMGRSAYSGGERNFTDLRLRIVLLGLPHTLQLPPEQAPKPDENVGAFLDRVIADAKAKHAWPLMLRAVQARSGLLNPMDGRGYSVSAGLQALVVASNRETVGQYALAVTSYQDALKDTADLVPTDFVRERLQAIQREHGKEFDEGMKQYEAQAPRDSRYPFGLP